MVSTSKKMPFDMTNGICRIIVILLFSVRVLSRRVGRSRGQDAASAICGTIRQA